MQQKLQRLQDVAARGCKSVPSGVSRCHFDYEARCSEQTRRMMRPCVRLHMKTCATDITGPPGRASLPGFFAFLCFYPPLSHLTSDRMIFSSSPDISVTQAPPSESGITGRIDASCLPYLPPLPLSTPFKHIHPPSRSHFSAAATADTR